MIKIYFVYGLTLQSILLYYILNYKWLFDINESTISESENQLTSDVSTASTATVLVDDALGLPHKIP